MRRNFYCNVKCKVKLKFLVGDRIRISKSQRTLKKGYLSYWTEEIFTVCKKMTKDHPVYPVIQQQKIDQSIVSSPEKLASQNLCFSTHTKTRQLNLSCCMLWLAALAAPTMFIYILRSCSVTSESFVELQIVTK